MRLHRRTWLVLLMALVMMFTAPMQAFALQQSVAACHTMVGDRAQSGVRGEHCTHAAQQATSVDQASVGHSMYDACGAASCLGTCGACAHCPAGISISLMAPEAPGKHFRMLAQRHPNDVAPEAALRPPRLFS